MSEDSNAGNNQSASAISRVGRNSVSDNLSAGIAAGQDMSKLLVVKRSDLSFNPEDSAIELPPAIVFSRVFI